MTKKISLIIFKLIFFVSKFIEKIFGKDLLIYFKEFLEENSYTSKLVCEKKINFFTPNFITKWRVDTFYSKEPETLDWIDCFVKDKKIVFWDIGANIGLYSIYAALKFDNINITAFEPSTSNLRILSRNISKNNLSEKIRINQIPLTHKKNEFLMMQESRFIEGGAMNSFGENIDFKGEVFKPENLYKVYGTSIDYLIESKILDVPNYIKIDVDGIEHHILRGGLNLLKNENLKSISIELNENFKAQYNEAVNIMKESNFKLRHKKHSMELEKNNKFSKVYNYVFER